MQSVNSIMTQAAANAFAFNKEKGTLELLNSQQTGGEDPCYIIASGNNVITANYSGGSISVFPIAKMVRSYPLPILYNSKVRE